MIQENDICKLSYKILARKESVFSGDYNASREALAKAIKGTRILVIGGAGSIGSWTVKELVKYSPKTIHIVDLSENSLVEIVRDYRSSTFSSRHPERSPEGEVEGSSTIKEIEEFKTFPIDYGSINMLRFLNVREPYDFVMNFAALKHVRSEKDVATLLQMVDVNVAKMDQFVSWLVEYNKCKKYFAVSTDKAANPVNFMGASKRMMEHTIFNCGGKMAVTSSRFANVAFSNGSLLEGFLHRINKKQPISLPEKTKRFFITLEEAAQICTIGAVLGKNKHILIPKFTSNDNLIELEEIGEKVLDYFGYKSRKYTDEFEAKENIESDIKEGYYPMLLTKLNTSGEKPYEEFVSIGEKTTEIGMKSLEAVLYKTFDDVSLLKIAIRKLKGIIDDPETKVTKSLVAEIFKKIIPEFDHIETGKDLDSRM